MINRLISFFILAFASVTCSADGTTGAGMIRIIQFYNGHVGVLIRHASVINPDGCGAADWIIMADTYPHYKDAYALLLAAKISGQPVTIDVSGCLQGYPQLRNVTLSS